MDLLIILFCKLYMYFRRVCVLFLLLLLYSIIVIYYYPNSIDMSLDWDKAGFQAKQWTRTEQTGSEWNRMLMRQKGTITNLHIQTCVNYNLLALHTSWESRQRRETFAHQIMIDRDDRQDHVLFLGGSEQLRCVLLTTTFYLFSFFIHFQFLWYFYA